MDAIIFLAPISGFDLALAEDPSVNRLVGCGTKRSISFSLTHNCNLPNSQEDSVLLWKMICSNELLAHVELVLFLNKCDILDKKLKSGVRLSKYVRSFQDRSNDSETVQKCSYCIALTLTIIIC